MTWDLLTQQTDSNYTTRTAQFVIFTGLAKSMEIIFSLCGVLTCTELTGLLYLQQNKHMTINGIINDKKSSQAF